MWVRRLYGMLISLPTPRYEKGRGEDVLEGGPGPIIMMRKVGSKSSQNSRPKRNYYLTSTWKVSWRLAATSHASPESSNPEGLSRLNSSASGTTLLIWSIWSTTVTLL